MSFRHTLSGLALATAIGFSAGAPAQAAEKFQQAQDMPYGVALYDYFQGNYFDALSTLMVAERRGSIQTHSDNAALIEGGISLGFGLGDRAAELFQRQLELSANNPDKLAAQRALAWRRLAELSYRRSDWALSADQLQKSGIARQTPLAVNLALRENALDRAAELLDKEDDYPLAERVLGFLNLAAAHARAEHFSAAIPYYHRAAALAEDGAEDDRELAILRDRANIGAGYSFALQQQFEPALAEFRQVRLETPWAPRALLGLGWAASQAGQPDAAADAFLFLQQHHPHTAEAREALVALSHAYEQLNQPTAALAGYQRAEARLEKILADLKALEAQVSTQQFHVQAGADRQRYGWLQVVETPEFLRDHQQPLQRILESDRFQLRLSELRDLRQLSGVITAWQSKLPQFAQLISARGERRRDIVSSFNSAQYDQQLDIARARYRALADGLAEVKRKRDGLTLLAQTESETAELLEILEDAQQRLTALENSGKVREYQRQTVERARGLLLWQASQQYHHNLWQQQQALTALETELQRADKNADSTARTASLAPQLSELRGRVDTAAPQLARQQSRLLQAAGQIEASIRRDVLAELSRQRQQTVQYLAHSRLAIARLQDEALQGTAPTATPEASDG
ncbi:MULTISPECIES: hypothetical protein [Microbulbifer]|nr:MULTISPECIES: hypothetical protein [Microbulbifer]